MHRRWSVAVDISVAVLSTLLLAGVEPAAAQSAAAAAKSTATAPATKRTPPRMPDGRADLQGVWTNATYTPFERPVDLAGNEFFTEEEAAAYEQKRLDEENSQPEDDIHYDNVIYNSNLQIVQTPGYVMILQEMIHDVRVIPLDGRPHLPQEIRQWMGDSRGRWDGDTLVVETTNFTDRTNFRGSSASLHVVERFTPIDADAIRYQFTVEDPATWTRPWTAEIAMRRFPERIFEYACHEGNHDLEFLLSEARDR